MRTYSRRKFLALGTTGAAAAAVTAACGGNGEDDATPAPTATGASAGGSPTLATGADNAAVGLRWYGQSMFVFTSPGGATVLMDPFNDIGYTVPPPLNTGAATITHEHQDHNNDALGGSARLFRGLTADGWADIDETVAGIRIRTVRTYHDDQQGAQRGRNTVFVYEVAGLRLAHLGDLGHQLDDQQLAAIGPVDVLMVPVGGNFTIDAAGATSVTAALQPRVVFPMHYKTGRITLPLDTADAFLEGKTVRRAGSTTLRLTSADLPDTLTAYVLDYE
jgi:L-ascorbate metabolism protein UlaG (beta-lactamase superfamily)